MRTLRKAVFPVAGLGTRFLPATKSIPKEMLPIVDRARRETCHASDLVLALQCGGSDGYSGITANTALGAAVDEVIDAGATVIHCDVMDGQFVPPITFGAQIVAQLRDRLPDPASSPSAAMPDRAAPRTR